MLSRNVSNLFHEQIENCDAAHAMKSLLLEVGEQSKILRGFSASVGAQLAAVDED